MDEHNSILERIHASYYQLTGAERRVADYVLSRYTQVQFMSITQLAEECGTAEATVSRFCRSLKLKGFNAFKIELARYSASTDTAKPPERHAGTLAEHNSEAARLAIDAIRQTVELAEPRQLQEAVSLIEAADRVLCFGSGGSMILAAECAHTFSTVSSKFYAIPDSHLQMSAVAAMGPQELIILFSYSGATNNGLQILELAKTKGVPTILVTRYHKSPAAKLADVVLLCGSSEGPFQLASAPARIAQLMVVDLIFREYYSRNQERCDEHIQSIAAALSNMHI